MDYRWLGGLQGCGSKAPALRCCRVGEAAPRSARLMLPRFHRRRRGRFHATDPARLLPLSRAGVRRRPDSQGDDAGVRGGGAAGAAVEGTGAADGAVARSRARARRRRRLAVGAPGDGRGDSAASDERRSRRALRRARAHAGAHLDDRLARDAAQRPRLGRLPDVSRRRAHLRVRHAQAGRSELHWPAGRGCPRADLSVPRRHLRQRARVAPERASGERRRIRRCRLRARVAMRSRIRSTRIRRRRCGVWQSAAAAFPRSPAIAVTIGNVYRRWEEWADALEAYDAALAVSPAHPEALIGRAISLSHLERSHEAIATATQVIDAGQWHLGEAYLLARLEPAAARAARSRARRCRPRQDADVQCRGVRAVRRDRMASAPAGHGGAGVSVGDRHRLRRVRSGARSRRGSRRAPEAGRGAGGVSAGAAVLRPVDRAAPRGDRQGAGRARHRHGQGPRHRAPPARADRTRSAGATRRCAPSPSSMPRSSGVP